MGFIIKSFTIIATSLILLPLSIYGNTIHVLATGETLYSLSRTYKVSLDKILAENAISDPSGLPVGTRLIIPGEASLPAERSENILNHTVIKGDTYYSIARRYGLSVGKLLELNSQKASDVLSIGDLLRVGTSEAASSVQAAPVAPGVVQSTPSASRPSRPQPVKQPASSRVENIPWWPVAGIKRPLEGKLVGVSITTDSLSYVYAVADGDVVWTGPYRGFGQVVLIDSGGYIYLYGGNEDLFVNVGQKISAGSRIGRLGAASPGGGQREMYFSVFREGVPVAPEDAPRSM